MNHSDLELPGVVAAFTYESGQGRCLVRPEGEPPRYAIYLEDDGKRPVIMESHSTQKSAESVARWMASGL